MFYCGEFSYDGRQSSEFGLKIINSGPGLVESPYAMARSIVSDKTPYNPMPYYFGAASEPFKFNVELYSTTPWTEKKRREVARWLFQPTYKPFISSDNPDLVYYALCVDDASALLGAGHYGSVRLNFVCNAPWPWSKQMIIDLDCRYNNDGKPYTFDINNISNENNWQPIFEIELKIPEFTAKDYPGGNTPAVNENSLYYSFRNIRNTRPDTGSPPRENSFVLSSAKFPKAPLYKGETISINMFTETVLSDKYKFRIRNTNEKWITLDWGINTIEVVGMCVLRVRCMFPILR